MKEAGGGGGGGGATPDMFVSGLPEVCLGANEIICQTMQLEKVIHPACWSHAGHMLVHAGHILGPSHIPSPMHLQFNNLA
jgi:hypothetical protein